MKKYSLLLGALGGAVAGYLFSNDKLRGELSKAKNADEAGKILSKHLSTDGKKLGGQVKEFVSSDAFQDNVSGAKKYAKDYLAKAQKEMQSLLKKGKVGASKMMKKGKAKAAAQKQK